MFDPFSHWGETELHRGVVLTHYSPCLTPSVIEARQNYSEEQTRQASALSSISLAAVTSYFSINSASKQDDDASKDDIGLQSHSNSLFSRSTRRPRDTQLPCNPSMLVGSFLQSLHARGMLPWIFTSRNVSRDFSSCITWHHQHASCRYVSMPPQNLRFYQKTLKLNNFSL